MRSLRFLLVLLAGLVCASPAWPHASLLRIDPPAGSVQAQAPEKLTLAFNEPVSPLVLQIVTPDGARLPLSDAASTNDTVVVRLPPALARGTHVVSWRVVSGDGHPVGGAFAFSVGAPSDNNATAAQSSGAARVALWAVKIVFYVGLFVGVGGALYRAFVVEGRELAGAASRIVFGALIAGALAAMFSIGLQGLDALARPLSGLASGEAWQAGLATAYKNTAQLATWGTIAGLASMQSARPRPGKLLALLAAALASAALASSGHAANAQPQWLMRAAVFVHTASLLFWIGALVPLAAAVRVAGVASPELRRFSRAIPLAIAALIVSGGVLAFVQVARLDALWNTPYGLVLCGKLTALVLLFGFAAWNRFRLVPRLSSDAAAMGRFGRSVLAEIGLVLAILALVAMWRFTPPPRALTPPAPVFVHIHTDAAMAELSLDPRRGPQDVTLRLLDGAFGPLAAKEVTLMMSNAAAGIEPLRWPATQAADGAWRATNVSLPVGGSWRVRVEILVDDFTRIAVEDSVELPR